MKSTIEVLGTATNGVPVTEADADRLAEAFAAAADPLDGAAVVRPGRPPLGGRRPMGLNPSPRVSFRVEADDLVALRELASRLGTSPSELLRETTKELIEQTKSQARPSLRRATRSAAATVLPAHPPTGS